MNDVTHKKNKLLEKAADFGGFFSSKDAVAAGYATNNHSYFVRTGSWERYSRGVYRISGYPMPSRPEYYAAAIYLRGREGETQGVFTLASAAAIYEVGDFMPSQIFVAVRPDFDRKVIPDNMIIHRSKTALEDYELIDGLPVASSLSMIKDFLIQKISSEEEVSKAYRDAREKGLLTSVTVRRFFDSDESKKFPEIKAWEDTK